MKQFKIGDYVKYRSWRPGDTPLAETPEWRRGWDQTGMIVELGDWQVGNDIRPGEMAIILTKDGDLCELWLEDVEGVMK